MKIVHLVCTFPPYLGGMGNSVRQMVEQLATARPDYDLTVVCPAYGHQAPVLLVPKASRSTYRIIRLASWFRFGNAAMVKGLDKIWRSTDIVHLHYPFYGTDALVWWLKKIYPATKLVLHYHMDPQAGGWRGWLFQIFQKLFLARLLKQAEIITCASLDYWQASIAGRLSLDLTGKLLIVPFRVDTDRFQPRPRDPQLLSQLGLKAERLTILMVGGLDKAHYFKGVEVFLKSLAILNRDYPELNYQAIIVGAGDLQSGYESMAKQMGLSKRICFAGAVDAAGLPQFYNLADLFVLPSINRCEAFGLVLLEAMASGLPCLASDLPGVRQVIDPPNNGLLIQPNNAIDLAEKISLVLTDKQKLLNMAQASRQRAEQYFSSAGLSELAEIYLSIGEKK
jgi:glycosyltransferase involved in cell wall biosynthesis